MTEWRGKPIPFGLHHINGDGLDNRLDNLLARFPKCHSQTDTWKLRNRRWVAA
jgi:hypothetical protein